MQKIISYVITFEQKESAFSVSLKESSMFLCFTKSLERPIEILRLLETKPKSVSFYVKFSEI